MVATEMATGGAERTTQTAVERCVAANMGRVAGRCHHAATVMTGTGERICTDHWRVLRMDGSIWASVGGRIWTITREVR